MTDQEQGPVYFWREFDEDYGFLSQWYKCYFQHDGVHYTSTEMWMMAQKAVLFGDHNIADQIVKEDTPRKQQALGRQVKGFDRKKWDQNKSRIVEEGNWHKFTSSTESSRLRKALLDTGDRELVEASPRDGIWGIGFDAANAEANRAEWGENLLGKALMSVRARLREGSPKS